MKNQIYILIVFIAFSCNSTSEKAVQIDGFEIIKKSANYHDPGNKWENSQLKIHIQEPRINNPFRYSEIRLNVSNGKFELQRNREKHISKHTIDAEGNSNVFLDNDINIEKEYIEKYKLDPKRNFKYRDFYKMIIGLPMSLKDSAINKMNNVELEKFNNSACFKVPIELNNAIFSKHWHLFFDRSTYEFKGMEIIFPKDKTMGERLFFEGEIIIDGMKIPRIRHWYEYYDNSYSGSDIIIKRLD